MIYVTIQPPIVTSTLDTCSAQAAGELVEENVPDINQDEECHQVYRAHVDNLTKCTVPAGLCILWFLPDLQQALYGSAQPNIQRSSKWRGPRSCVLKRNTTIARTALVIAMHSELR